MKNRRNFILLSGITLCAITALLLRPEPGSSLSLAGQIPTTRPTVDQSPFGAVDPKSSEAPPTAAPEETPADFGAWANEPLPVPDRSKIEAFDGWIAQWNAATPAERKAMEEEGAQLAAARRPEFKALIMSDPRGAIEGSVPRVIRQDLPASIVAELESPVSATGDLDVYKGRPAPGKPLPAQGLTLRYFEVQGMSYCPAR